MSDQPFEANPDEDKYQDGDRWENRILCSDENCIGVIGPDGRCKECGKPYKEPPPAAEEPQPAPAQTAPGAGDAADELQRSEDSAEVDPDDWENRTLCSDENCIGVIGPDGRCKECGKPHQG
jgi:hypothetical protein